MLAPIQEIWLQFLADRTNGCAYGTVLRLSVVVCNVCIVAKRCVLEQKLLLCLMPYTRRRMDWHRRTSLTSVDQSQPSVADL